MAARELCEKRKTIASFKKFELVEETKIDTFKIGIQPNWRYNGNTQPTDWQS
jgi:hypothetical protein